MSNKELRDAIFVRYRVCVKRRWYYLILLLVYFAMGITAQITHLGHDGGNPYVLVAGVFAIIGVVSIEMLELTRHEKGQYIIPMTYDERKRYYFIGIVINFSITLVICLLFIMISLLIDRSYGIEVIKLFAMCGLPYIQLSAFQKINMFKGKKKKDNPKSVYISYVVGIVIGLGFVALFPTLPYVMKSDRLLGVLIVCLNLAALARVLYAGIEIMKKNTDYENVKVKEMLALKKLM